MRFVWLLLFLLFAAGVYIYLNPGIKSQLLNQSPVPGQSRVVRAYKWKNDRGEWQITDTLPPEGVEYERLEHRTDENVLPVPPQLTPKK